MKTRATITGWGKCVPPVKLTNDDLTKLVDTTEEWILERTGIRERGISHVETTDMAEVAAHRALAAAGLDVTDIDMLIMATVTPEITCPSNACFLQERIGAVNAAAFDLNAACSGWVYGTATASSMIEAGVARLTPKRKTMRVSSVTPALRAAMPSCTTTAHFTASTTLGNSNSSPSPMVLTIRPPCSAIRGSISSARWAQGIQCARLVRAHETRIANYVGGDDRRQSALRSLGHA